MRSGLLAPDQARWHPDQNRLERAIGLRGPLAPALTCRRLLAGDRVLVCSDGLWDVLGDEEIGALLSGDAPVCRVAGELVDRANARGGPDNITVVAYAHEDAGY